eukprot:1161364-Pelagomonas_calceolata.AAC.2
MGVGGKKRKKLQAGKTLPTSIKEKETHWLRRAMSPLHHRATRRRMLMGSGGLPETFSSRAWL